MDLNEQLQQNKAETMAERALHKYREHVELLESKSPLSKVRAVTAFDIAAMGTQLENFELYRSMCEADGTVSQLGVLPRVALDVISTAFGVNPLSAIASTQNIEEEQGSIYYRQVIARTTRGSVTAGDVLTDPRTPNTGTSGFAGGHISNEALGNTAAATTTYNLTLADLPVRPSSVTVNFASAGQTAVDDGNGVLNGNGVWGTINYTTGAVVLNFATQPANPQAITASYDVDSDGMADLPHVQSNLTSTSIKAEVFALRTSTGLLQSFALRKRFGSMAEDEAAQDLVNAIVAETVHTAITRANAVAVGSVTFPIAVPSGVSRAEHIDSLVNYIADAESNMLGNSGVGQVNAIVAGRTLAADLSGVKGFQRIGEINTTGPHIFGTLNGITIVRVPLAATLAAVDGVCLYKGSSPFDASIIRATYMPLVSTAVLPMGGTQPLMNQRAAATWEGISVPTPALVTKITKA